MSKAFDAKSLFAPAVRFMVLVAAVIGVGVPVSNFVWDYEDRAIKRIEALEEVVMPLLVEYRVHKELARLAETNVTPLPMSPSTAVDMNASADYSTIQEDAERWAEDTLRRAKNSKGG